MTAEILYMEPREVVTSIGRHRLFLKFKPNAEISERWSWLLKVTKTFEYTGEAATQADCTTAARKFVDFHTNMERMYE